MTRRGAKLSAAGRAANRRALARSLGGLRQLRAQGVLMPREGQGDYRLAEQATDAVRNGRTNPDSLWHNPAPVRTAGAGHAGGQVHRQVFQPVRNGQPEFVPYVWGAPRPRRATVGIDYAAIAAADAEIERKSLKRQNEVAEKYRRRAGMRPNRRGSDYYAAPQPQAPGTALGFRVREAS
jgi:hypothetical protein